MQKSLGPETIKRSVNYDGSGFEALDSANVV
jgi:hypothetical protein